MRKLLKRLFLFGFGTLFVVLLYLWPRLPDGEAYFSDISSRSLQADEVGQWNYLRYLYSEMDATGDLFKDWQKESQLFWKYAIAFTAYGLPSLAMIEPKQRDLASYYLYIMINKMKEKKVWQEWQDFGFGKDPICKQNIMYKGHLNLMYGLYSLMSNRDDFEKEFVYLTKIIVDELGETHKDGQYEGIACEPNRFFVHCNAITLLSLEIHDKLYGTTYMQSHGSLVLSFIKNNLRDGVSGLYWKMYHPTHDLVEHYISSYTNAWALVILNYFEPEIHKSLYKVWKKSFVHEWGPFAYVAETQTGGVSRLASLFGIWAAKEFRDIDLFEKLRNSFDVFGNLSWQGEDDVMLYSNLDNTLGNGMILAFKLHMGWKEILDFPWSARIREIPDTSQMSWTDLFQESSSVSNGKISKKDRVDISL